MLERVGLFCGTAALVTLAACNAIVGVEDVSGRSANCDLPAQTALVVSDPGGTILEYVSRDGVIANIPHLEIGFIGSALITMELYDGFENNRTVNATGTQKLTEADSDKQNCSICISMENLYTRSDTIDQMYFARPGAELELTQTDTVGMVGKITNLQLRHIDSDKFNAGVTVDVNDGCDVAIENVTFSAQYPPADPPPTTTP